MTCSQLTEMEDDHNTDHPGIREANKICGVCGDKALGYNFNAVSCESCKAFFRRNALKNKDFRCPFSDDCNVTPVTRRFCQKCRLDKCFSVGMKKEYIMTEEDKVLKRQKIERNRAKKRSSSEALKSSKMKSELLQESNFDDNSVSIASVASTNSETYFWDSERNCKEDNHSRSMIESPVTTASIPSPTSPSENHDIIGSKTLDMMSDSLNTSDKIFIKCQNDDKFYVNPEKYQNNDEEPSSSCNVKKSLFENNRKINIHDELNFSNQMNKIKNELSVSNFDCNYSQSELLISKLTHTPNFIVKVIESNPQLIAKILEEKNVISDIMSDPSVIELLINDPNIFHLLKQNNTNNNNKVIFDDKDDDNNTLQNEKQKQQQQQQQQQIKLKNNDTSNPILSNLIGSNKSIESDSNTKEYIIKNNNCNKRINDEDVTRDVVEDVQRIPIAINSIESILCEAIKLEFSTYSSLSCNQNSRELNDAERAKLNELIVANKALLAPLDDDITNLVGEECKFKDNSGNSNPALLDVINLTAIAIRRLIKMSKKINAFKNMCQEDQLALLKGGCTEMMILRSASSYDSDKDIWKIPHSQENMSNIKVDVLKEAKGNLYSEHSKFVRTFDPRWRDENIILILSAIALFTPDRPRVIHNDVIKLEQNSYYYLLRRYLESIYPGCEAKSTFLKLIQKISELHKVNNEVVGVYLNVNPSNVEPLLIEIFDLKN